MAFPYETKRATLATSADAAIVAAVSGKAIVVVSAVIGQLEAAANQQGRITSNNASGAVLLQPFEVAPLTPLVLPFSEVGWFETVAGEALFFDMLTGGTTPLWRLTVNYYLR